MMKQTFQALVLATVCTAIEAETEIEAMNANDATFYGMNFNGVTIPSPKIGTNAFPTNLTVGGGTVPPVIDPAVQVMIDKMNARGDAGWNNWNTVAYRAIPRTTHTDGEQYFTEQMKNPKDYCQKFVFEFGTGYTHLYPASQIQILKPNEIETNVARYNVKNTAFSWATVYKLKISKVDCPIEPVTPVVPPTTVVPPPTTVVPPPTTVVPPPTTVVPPPTTVVPPPTTVVPPPTTVVPPPTTVVPPPTTVVPPPTTVVPPTTVTPVTPPTTTTASGYTSLETATSTNAAGATVVTVNTKADGADGSNIDTTTIYTNAQ